MRIENLQPRLLLYYQHYLCAQQHVSVQFPSAFPHRSTGPHCSSESMRGVIICMQQSRANGWPRQGCLISCPNAPTRYIGESSSTFNVCFCMLCPWAVYCTSVFPEKTTCAPAGSSPGLANIIRSQFGYIVCIFIQGHALLLGINRKMWIAQSYPASPDQYSYFILQVGTVELT